MLEVDSFSFADNNGVIYLCACLHGSNRVIECEVSAPSKY